jgi:hypothetical protein
MANDGIRLARYTPTNHPMLEPTKDNSTIVTDSIVVMKWIFFVNFSQEYAVVNFIHMLHLVHLNEGLRLEREARKKPGKKISLIKKIDLALISRP